MEMITIPKYKYLKMIKQIKTLEKIEKLDLDLVRQFSGSLEDVKNGNIIRVA